MRNYFSCTALADWIRGTTKLNSGSGKDWREWEQIAKEKHPIRYWIAEEGLDKLQDFIMFIPDKLYAIKYWLVNRFITRTHQLTSNLARGKWYEFEERVLNCLFDELVNFVEIESAWNHIIWNEEARKKYDPPFTAAGWFRLRIWRSPEAGIASLEWQTKLVKDEDWGYEKDHPEYETPTHQAISAEEILELYNWWKNIRPNRPDPYDASGWSEICNKRRESNNGEFWWTESETQEEKIETNNSLDKLRELEEEYEKEDEEMLIKLIKVRRSMWT